MQFSPNLFPRFADLIRSLPATAIANPRSTPDLLLGEGNVGRRHIQMVYAPFDHVNDSARLVIVGLTPGAQQAANALRAAQNALLSGDDNAKASERAKIFASFSGPMRSNLVAMLDDVGIARWLGLSTTAKLWGDEAQLVHFTSALRYPVFVDGTNWSGTPDLLRTAMMRSWLEAYTGAELAQFKDAAFVPLGPKVAGALYHLAQAGNIRRDQILDGMPHPSGANAERIAYFLRRKPIDRLSTRTNPIPIDTARKCLIEKVAAL